MTLSAEQQSAAVDSIERALCDSALADQVEMVITSPTAGHYRAATVDGAVEFRREIGDAGYSYELVSTQGRDPLADQTADRHLGLASERAAIPTRDSNSYPHAFESIAQFFDSPHAPDVWAMHASSHHFGGYLGQHGSLAVIQSRAPFLAAGAGIVAGGLRPGSTRIVDVAPTIAQLLDVDPCPGAIGHTGRPDPAALLARQDGAPIDQLLDGSGADHVVAFLLDGCNANLFHDVIAAGEAPHLAALLDRGVALESGAMAAAPTATLANHNSALTGAFPGNSGVLHNTWLDRRSGESIDLLAMDQMFWSADHLVDPVETLFEAIHRTDPDAFTTATFEFCDRGADFSSFELMRTRRRPPFPDRDDVAHLSHDMAEVEPQYEFMSMVDHTSAAHTISAWRREHGNPLPRFSWCSFALTDEAGHRSGPHGEMARAAVRDSDGRVGDVIAAVEQAGVLEQTAFLVLADHGMEQNDPDNSTTWEAALESTGVPHRQLDESLIYVEGD